MDSIKDIAISVINWATLTNVELSEARLKICRVNSCGQFNRKWNSCSQCGCNLSLRTSNKKLHCPFRLW